MMGHGFFRQITEKFGTKYGNENYILGHPKWKWELYFGTEVVFSGQDMKLGGMALFGSPINWLRRSKL